MFLSNKKISITNAEKLIHSGARPGESTPLKTKKPSRHRPASKKASALPQTVEAWTYFKVSDKLKEYFRQDSSGLFVSRSSIIKPILSLYYYEKLYEKLCQSGFHHLAVKVLALMSYLADELLDVPSLCSLMDLKMANLCEKLNLLDASSKYYEKLNELKLSMEEQAM